MRDRLIERFYLWLAFRLPLELARLAAVRVMSAASTHPDNASKTPSDISVIDVLKTW